MKMHNGRVFFCWRGRCLNLYVRVKIHVALFDTNHSVTVNMQSIAATIQNLPEFVV